MSAQNKIEVCFKKKHRTPSLPRKSIRTTISAHHLFHSGIIEHHLFVVMIFHLCTLEHFQQHGFQPCLEFLPIYMTQFALMAKSIHFNSPLSQVGTAGGWPPWHRRHFFKLRLANKEPILQLWHSKLLQDVNLAGRGEIIGVSFQQKGVTIWNTTTVPLPNTLLLFYCAHTHIYCGVIASRTHNPFSFTSRSYLSFTSFTNSGAPGCNTLSAITLAPGRRRRSAIAKSYEGFYCKEVNQVEFPWVSKYDRFF